MYLEIVRHFNGQNAITILSVTCKEEAEEIIQVLRKYHENEALKIVLKQKGKSKNFRKRMGEYTQLYATPEIIIVEWVRDYHNFEKRLHRRFKKKNVRGEWFKLSRLEVLFAKILIKFKKGRKNT